VVRLPSLFLNFEAEAGDGSLLTTTALDDSVTVWEVKSLTRESTHRTGTIRCLRQEKTVWRAIRMRLQTHFTLGAHYI
jgi:hypothetical protein